MSGINALIKGTHSENPTVYEQGSDSRQTLHLEAP